MSDLFLSDLTQNQSCTVVGFNQNIETKIKRRLLELGFYISAEIKLSQISFLGDVILVELNGYMLSIRKSIAKNIIVKRVSK